MNDDVTSTSGLLGVVRHSMTPSYQRHPAPPLGYPYGHGYVRPPHVPPCIPGHPTIPCPVGQLPGPDDVSWNAMQQLMLLSFVTTAGAIGGIFIICAVTVIDRLQVRGNAYLVSLAFGHLMVTIFVIPASVVAIMAGVPTDATVCHFQWLATLSCLLVSVLSFMLMAIENYCGLGSIVSYSFCCTKFRVVVVIALIWSLAVAVPVVHHIYGLGPAFCSASKQQAIIWLEYHPYLLLFGVLLPTLITVYYFTLSLFRLKRYKLQMRSYRPDPLVFFLTDEYLLTSNCYVFAVSLAMWMPMVVVMVVDYFNPVSEELMTWTWWLALAFSCCYPYIYAGTNRDFRGAFNKLFYYSCCKAHVNFARKGAIQRRTLAINDTHGLRLHIIPGLLDPMVTQRHRMQHNPIDDVI